MKNSSVNSSPPFIAIISFVQELTVETVSKSTISTLKVLNALVEKYSVSSASLMITVHVHVRKRKNGWKMYSRKKQMLNGCQFMPNCVPGAKRPSKEAQDVTSWPVYVGKTSATYVPAHGSLTTKTTSSVTFISIALQKQ